MRIAESALERLHWNAPTEPATELISASPPQPVLTVMTWFGFTDVFVSVSCGSLSVPGKPNGAAARAGPEARISMVFEVVPPTTKPAATACAPEPTWISAERLTRRGVVTVYIPAGVAS